MAISVKDNDFNKSLKVIGLCSINREEWLVTDLACNLIGVTSVPLYETLGDEMLEMILKQTELSTLFGSEACLLNILRLVNGKIDSLRQIVLFDELSKDLEKLAEEMGIEILNYHQISQQIRNCNFDLIKDSHDDLDSVFTISYTSGTSGNSKGVMLSNRNFLSAITNILRMAA